MNKPGSRYLTKHHGSVNSSDAPPLYTIKARCPEPPIAQQPLHFKKYTHFHWSPCSAHISNSDAPREEKGHFYPANSGLALLTPQLKVRARDCFPSVKNNVSSLYLHFFQAKMTKYSRCVVHHLSHNAAKNTQQSTEKSRQGTLII
jgi:hypothetical protein